MNEFEDRGETLRVSPIEFDEETREIFDSFFDHLLKHGLNNDVDYDLASPKYEFLCYLTDCKGVVLHGSGRGDIEVFEPRWQTDAVGRPLQRVYATRDGIWPMYFAILDRENYKGSLRNGFWREEDEEGNVQRFYQFSINKDELAKGPWRRGYVYILPRDTFEQTRTLDGRGREEWSSSASVRPLARLVIEPNDFPFLNQVHGHDDSAALRLAELQEIVFGRIATYEKLSDGYLLRYPPQAELASALVELTESLWRNRLLEEITAEIGFEFTPPGLTLRIRGPQAKGLIESILKKSPE